MSIGRVTGGKRDTLGCDHGARPSFSGDLRCSTKTITQVRLVKARYSAYRIVEDGCARASDEEIRHCAFPKRMSRRQIFFLEETTFVSCGWLLPAGSKTVHKEGVRTVIPTASTGEEEDQDRRFVRFVGGALNGSSGQWWRG